MINRKAKAADSEVLLDGLWRRQRSCRADCHGHAVQKWGVDIMLQPLVLATQHLLQLDRGIHH